MIVFMAHFSFRMMFFLQENYVSLFRIYEDLKDANRSDLLLLEMIDRDIPISPVRVLFEFDIFLMKCHFQSSRPFFSLSLAVSFSMMKSGCFCDLLRILIPQEIYRSVLNSLSSSRQHVLRLTALVRRVSERGFGAFVPPRAFTVCISGLAYSGQPQAAASIRFWPPSRAKLPPSNAASAMP